ncbi:DUF4232 domain-containing protein [Streptomyces sp. NBC_01356]|uniref:DUF4232 domain-containing protein n=1 Tax=Streptomyces sp. NBC_01356 TaxID=2903836 RepID=UPI002E2FCC95|nr:DUF4232 domain-containing protein [Streptomyces sp. NBC_01356]
MRNNKRIGRRVTGGAIAAVSTLALVGLTAGTSQAAAVSPSRTAAARPAWADTNSLSVRIHPLSPGAGQRYASVVLTNKTHKTVRTQGYTGLQLLNSHGKNVTTHVVRDPGHTPLLTLKPGQSVHTTLHWTIVGAKGEPTKGEKNPTALEVTPPDSRHHLTTAWKLGDVLQKGRIDITPLAKGTGPKN